MQKQRYTNANTLYERDRSSETVARLHLRKISHHDASRTVHLPVRVKEACIFESSRLVIARNQEEAKLKKSVVAIVPDLLQPFVSLALLGDETLLCENRTRIGFSGRSSNFPPLLVSYFLAGLSSCCPPSLL